MQVAMGWVGLQQGCKVFCNVLLHGGRHLGRAVAIVGVGSNIGVGYWCWQQHWCRHWIVCHGLCPCTIKMITHTPKHAKGPQCCYLVPLTTITQKANCTATHQVHAKLCLLVMFVVCYVCSLSACTPFENNVLWPSTTSYWP